MQHARPNRLRRAVAYAALAASLGLVSLTVSQCTLVGDSLTGVKLSRTQPTDCPHQCQDAFVACSKEAQKDHDADVEACKAIPGGPDRAACLEAADAAHNARKADCEADRDACLADCHRQGTGSAG